MTPGNAWFAIACGALLVVPPALSGSVTAGSCYLVSLVVGLLGKMALRGSALSFLPWAAAYALYPAFLSYGGWGGQTTGSAPLPVMVALASLLGVGVHVLVALPDLVVDHELGRRHLPLRIALHIGAPRRLVLASVYTGLVVVALLLAAPAFGLRQ